MGTDTTEILFTRSEPNSVVAAMKRMSAVGDCEGWINLQPLLSDDQAGAVPEQTSIGAWFSGRGPAVANATWTPARQGRRFRPSQIGVAHGTGPHALDRLDEAGAGLPAGWFKRQDHAKHGIVAEVPDTEDLARVLDWVLTACQQLRTVVDPGEDWVAVVHGFDLSAPTAG